MSATRGSMDRLIDGILYGAVSFVPWFAIREIFSLFVTLLSVYFLGTLETGVSGILWMPLIRLFGLPESKLKKN